MRQLLTLPVLVGVITTTGVCRPATAGEHRIVLKEHVGRQWTHELLSYPFEVPEGACHVDSLSLRGPEGPMPVQLSDVKLWPTTGTVKSATLWLVADLAPLATNEYTVGYQAAPSTGSGARGDLAVTAVADQVQLSTSRFAARLRLGGQTYSPPRPASEVPGPVEAMRLADGTWFGGSRLFGDTKLTGWSARLVAAGPVFGQVETTYRYEDGNTVELRARLYAGAAGLYWEAHVPEDRPDDGVDIVLSKGLPPLALVAQREAYGDRPEMQEVAWGTWVEIPLAGYEKELVTNVSPWADWWNTWTQTSVRLGIGGQKRELHLASHDPGAWVRPAEPGTMRDWGAWQHKLIPVKRGADGEVFLRVNHAAGARKWSVEDREPAYAEARRMSLAQVKAEWPPLDEVKDWILEWPTGGKVRPHLFASADDVRAAWERIEPDPAAKSLADSLSREEIRPVPSYKDAQAVEVYLMTRGDPEASKKVRLVERVRQHMAALGDFDKMRGTQTVAALYDLMMGTNLITDADKDLYRPQMAFLGYILARPSTWNIERGYRSYNPNMSLSYLLARGIVACAIPDHPMAREWVAPGLNRAEIWLGEVGPEGEWYESAHYSQVSAFAMTSFAVAVKRAGFGDLFLNENLKKWAMWLAQIYTPRDPMEGRRNRRASPPIARATAGVPWGLFGLMARATVDTDPRYSQQMQWAWAGSDYTTNTANHLGGFESVYMDPSLPVAVPDWKSKLFPQMGPLCRNGVGSEHENYLVVHANTGAGARLPELGCLALWFARGVPIAGSFPGGYKERHQLLMSRVNPLLSWSEGEPWDESRFGCATDVSMGSFSALPRQDYFSASYLLEGWKGGSYGTPENPVSWPPVDGTAEFPIGWCRRMLYVQDDEPGGANYLVLRDSTSGGKPSLWQMWTASEGIATPRQMQDLEAFLTSKPGNAAAAAHRLEGDRFTAVGRFNVDIDYYIAAPLQTERWTMRWGQRYVDYSVTGEDYRDLLQLRLEGDGDYFVVMFPRFREEAAPQFATLGEGTVVKISGELGTDYCFLPASSLQSPVSSLEREAAVGDVYFRGTAGSVQDRDDVKVLAIGAAGEARYGEWGISAPQAASVRVEAGRLVVDLPYAHEDGGEVTLRTAGRWKPAAGQAGVSLTPIEHGCRLVLEPGVAQVVLGEKGVRNLLCETPSFRQKVPDTFFSQGLAPDGNGRAGRGRPAPGAATRRAVRTPWGRQVRQRSDIDWDFVRPEGTPLAGQTNRAAAQQGYAPVRIDPQTAKVDDVVLHHALDDPRGTVIETWRSSHTRFHQTIGREPNPWRQQRPDWAQAWQREQSAYWRWRTGAYNPPPQPRLRLPGDPQ
ncbi:MAG: hypothetical protein ACYTG0_18850 [Planctomycetota bacterium]|jgi:hypothetical protein